MANTTLEKGEKQYLCEQLKKKYESESRKTWKPTTARNSYDSVAIDISDYIKKNRGQFKTNFEENFNVSDAQLQELFKFGGHRDTFLDACYIYLHQKTRADFLKENPPNIFFPEQVSPPQYESDEIEKLKADLEAYKEVKADLEKKMEGGNQYSSEIERLKQEKTGLEAEKKRLNGLLEEKKDASNDNIKLEDELQEARDIIIRDKKRYDYAKKISIIVACLALISCGAYLYYQKYHAPIIWKLSMPWAGETSSRAEMVRKIVKQVSDQTGGRFKIEIYSDARLPNSEGKAVDKLSDIFDAVKKNDIQMAHFSPYYLDSTFAAAMFWGSLPGGMDNVNLSKWLDSDGEKLRDILYEPFNIIAYSCGQTGPQMGGWFKKEIKDMKDFDSLRFRIGSPIGKAVLKSFGATIGDKIIPEGKIATLLATDELDGAEWIGIYDDWNLGLAGLRNFNWYYDSHWHEPDLMNDMLINKTAFNRLPENIQSILKDAIHKKGGDLYKTLHSEEKAKIKKKIEDKIGHKITPFPNNVEAALHARSLQKVEEFVKKNQNKLKFKETYISYWKYCHDEKLTCDCAKWKSWEEIVK